MSTLTTSEKIDKLYYHNLPTKLKEILHELDLAKLSATQAETVAVLGTTTNLTAIGASFADLAAARTAVNTLKTEVETRLDAIEAKIDALITSLKTAEILK